MFAPRRGPPIHRFAQLPVEALPGADPRPPLDGDLRQHVDARPHVLAALGVVGGGGRQGVRPAQPALGVGGVELGDGGAEAARVAAHLVERDQPVVAVEHGVLVALGHHRPGDLLEAPHEVQPLGAVGRVGPLREAQRQDVLHEVVDSALMVGVRRARPRPRARCRAVLGPRWHRRGVVPRRSASSASPTRSPT